MSRAAHTRRPKLPPLKLHPTFPQPVSTPLAMTEKESGLPYIMVTPSSPTHEKAFYYFDVPTQEEKTGLMNSLSGIFRPAQQSIALPPTPVSATHASTSFSSTKRLRLSLLLAIPIFIILHLFLLPPAEHGLYDIFTHGVNHHSAFSAMDGDIVSDGSWPSNAFEMGSPKADSVHGSSGAAPTVTNDYFDDLS